MVAQQRGGTPRRGTSTASGGRRPQSHHHGGERRLGTPRGVTHGDFDRNLNDLVERNHEGSDGSVSSSAKDPRETNLGSKGDQPQLDQEGWGRGPGGVHAGAAGEGSGRGGGREPRLAVKEHDTEPGGRGLDTGGHVPRR